MAPRRGGGGGGGGGVKSCSDYAFLDHRDVTYLVYYVLFTVAVIGILWAAGTIKKQPHAKQILGVTYFTALFFTLLGHLLYWIFLVVDECGTSVEYDAYAGVYITESIFWWIGDILLFVVLVWHLNMALQQRLGGLQQTLFQIISWVVIGIVAVIGATLVAINSYNTWSQWNNRGLGYSVYDEESFDLQLAAMKLAIAYRALYLVGALIGCAMALLSLLRLRSQARVTGLMVWIIIFTLSLVINSLFIISTRAVYLDDKWIRENTQFALNFLSLFFFHLAFVAVLFVAKDGAFAQQAGPYPPATYEQPAYNGPQYAAVPQENGPVYRPEQPAQLPNNQPAYYGQPQLDGAQRHEVKG